MKKVMKRIAVGVALVAVVALAVKLMDLPIEHSAKAAAYYGPSGMIISGTSPRTNIAAGVCSSTNVVRIDCRGATYLNFQLSGESTTSSTSNAMVLLIGANNDGIYAATLHSNLFTLFSPQLPLNGTTHVTTNHSVTLGGIAYVYIVTLTNSNSGGGAGAVTNYAVTWNLQ